jgi:membrane protein
MPRSQTDLASRILTFPVAVGKRFYEDNCLLHASALAYVSLLSMVPLFAVMFAVLKGLGVQRRLEPMLLSRLALDQEVVDQIIGYIDRTNVGTLGALGVALLLLTVISLLGSVEASFNHIWQVQSGRSFWRKATDYVSVVTLTPFLLLAAVALTSSIEQQSMLRWLLQTEFIGEAMLLSLRLAPVAMNVVALGVLYGVMPNRRPYWPAIVIGALVAGAAWYGVQLTYVRMQIGVARYNAIYGALAQLPVTLAWLYVSWTVVLAGAEVAAVFEVGADSLNRAVRPSRRAVALELLLQAGKRFRSTGEAIEPRAMARHLDSSVGTVREVVDSLIKAGWLAPVEGAEERYILARDPATIDLEHLERLVNVDAVPPRCDPRVGHALAEVDDARAQALRKWSLADLLEQTPETEVEHGIEDKPSTYAGGDR